MAQSKFRINIYVLVSSKTIRCPSNSPFSSSTHIAKRHETCKDPAIRFKFFIQEPVGNKPWVCSQTVGILDNPGALKKTLLVKNSHAQLLHSPLQWQDWGLVCRLEVVGGGRTAPVLNVNHQFGLIKVIFLLCTLTVIESFSSMVPLIWGWTD